MPPRCIPEQPFFRSDAERRVWAALRKKLRPVDVLLANIPFVAKDGSWEVDLIVLMPDVGFATIEVKGGYVRRADGLWRQQTPDGDKVIDLDEQSKSERYLVERYLKERWTFGKPRMAHFAALPDTDLGPEDPSPGLPRDRVIAKGDLAEAAGRVYDVLSGALANEPKRRARRGRGRGRGADPRRHRRPGPRSGGGRAAAGRARRRAHPHPVRPARLRPGGAEVRGGGRSRQRQDVPRAGAGAALGRGRRPGRVRLLLPRAGGLGQPVAR